MNLSDYIAKHGVDSCAKAWNVSERRVKSWRYGERFPRPEQARVIVAATAGAVTMDDIYGIQMPTQSAEAAA